MMEIAMNARRHVYLAATLAAGVALGALTIGIAHAQSGGVPTNPGSNATDKINAGGTIQAPSGSPPGANDASGTGGKVTNRAPPVDTTAANNQPIPTQAELRAALLSPDSGDPAIGQIGVTSPNTGEGNAASNSGPKSADPTTQSQGHAAVGGPLSPGAGKDGTANSGGQAAPSGQAAAPPSGQAGDKSAQPAQPAPAAGTETTGTPTAGEQKAVDAAKQTSPNKPIGSTTQTLPAKFSSRNALIDRAPVMALPFKLKDEQLKQIFQAAMNDKDGVAIDGANLKPATQLTAAQADAMRPLPGASDALKGLKYLKTKDKVLLVEPSTRIVLEEISG